MDLKEDMLLKRARSEIDSAVILFEASEKKEIKEEFSLDKDSTFFSGVISHSYYAIFYCAKALLSTKSIDTKSPEVHKKTFDEFKKEFIDSGLLDVKLLIIYKEMIVKADSLLEIYRQEKKKRGDFTYNTIPQANKEPAEESLKNAKMFYKHCNMFLINFKVEKDKGNKANK
jgi:uncharacterized protein (UPF0332 family)